MAGMVKMTGMSRVLRNLGKFNKGLENSMPRKLKKGGLFLQRESQKIVPIDEGNLKGGAFTRESGSGFKTDVTVGYVADYSVYVHEDMDAHHKSGKEAKFLEKPAKEKRKEILEVIVKG